MNDSYLVGRFRDLRLDREIPLLLDFPGIQAGLALQDCPELPAVRVVLEILDQESLSHRLHPVGQHLPGRLVNPALLHKWNIIFISVITEIRRVMRHLLTDSKLDILFAQYWAKRTERMTTVCAIRRYYLLYFLKHVITGRNTTVLILTNQSLILS